MTDGKEEHTPTPWTLFIGKHGEVVEISDANGLPVVGWLGFDDSRRSFEEHKANAALIIASVNKYVPMEEKLRG